jgi:hypothetical protein
MKEPDEFAADEVHRAVKGLGTDDRALIELITTRDGVEMERLKVSASCGAGTLLRLVTYPAGMADGRSSTKRSTAGRWWRPFARTPGMPLMVV